MADTKYLPELLAEKDSLDSSFTHAMKLITAEIDRIQKGETKKDPEKDISYLDIFATKNLKLKERVLIPTKQFPRVNFVGKLLGPQGNTIKRLQEETGAKISVLGKGSMRDKNKEEELRNGGEAKYAHLSLELHVFIEVMAPIPEAYLRMAHAMDEVKKFLTPEPGEVDPYMDPHYLNGSQDGSGRGRGGPGRGRGGPPGGPGPRGRGMMRGGPRGAMRGGAPRGGPGRGGTPRGAMSGRGGPASSARGGSSNRSRPPTTGAPRMLPAAALSHQQHQLPSGSQPKTEGYDEYPPYEESYGETSYEGYDSYYGQQPAPADTEYYDYGHGDAQESSYDQYAQDDWDASWSSGGAGGKAPSARQGKGSYREHPYGRY
ncbi:KH domain-containing, RNA-binding, signal transduction-associated protein 1a isoform X2 [Thalassophryne amazonica]|uniref:KH domain-containing, RNA-binding, signal transduction-associated protein 1a isoform X1 n=1 Tax=Thalassophryne amazonica TaxID=390379 RepID=UPI001471EAFA|nr:KH domain-containing, RNA-binding, signal transduction-associated protein 1a isoform X1 [Thalassophryne amazonica]XP_034051087.1 KH domain-containing, RNA-binding, signal transduction-associated protein 1a isoform X2 [Thalassophryne amazonica]